MQNVCKISADFLTIKFILKKKTSHFCRTSEQKILKNFLVGFRVYKCKRNYGSQTNGELHEKKPVIALFSL